MGNSFNSKGNTRIEGSAIAIGDQAAASVTSGSAQSADQADPAVEELRAELAKLVQRLRTVSGELADKEEVAGTAAEVEAELEAPAPRWHKVRDLLRRVGPSVATLTVLASDVRALETAVEAILSN